MEITVKRLAQIEAEFGKDITIYTVWSDDRLNLKMKFDRYKQVDVKRLNELLPANLQAREYDVDDEGSYAYELVRFHLTK